jgi:replicative DNA helicase
MTPDMLYSEDLEKAVLGGLFINPQQMTVIGKLSSSDFWLLRHAYIYDAMLRVHNSGKTINRLSVTAALKDFDLLEKVGGHLYISELINATPSALHTDQYAELVHRDGMRRRLLQMSDEIKELAADKTKAVEDVLATAQEHISNVRDDMYDPTAATSRQMVDEAFALLKEMSVGVIPTGMPRLDENLGGGIPQGNLSIIAGPSGLGKTWFAINVMVNVARKAWVGGRKMKVLFFTQEMTRLTEFNPRVLSVLSHDPGRQALAVNELRAAGKYIQNTPKAERFIQVVEELSGLDIVVDEKTTVTPAYVRDQIAKHRPDLVIVDYLQLMDGDKQYRSAHEKYGKISKALRIHAKQSGAAIVALCQLSREGIRSARDRQRPPYKEALKESGDIENESAVIAMLWQDDAMEDDEIISVAIRKNRYGKEYGGEFKTRPPCYKKHPETGRLVEIAVTRQYEKKDKAA